MKLSTRVTRLEGETKQEAEEEEDHKRKTEVPDRNMRAPQTRGEEEE